MPLIPCHSCGFMVWFATELDEKYRRCPDCGTTNENPFYEMEVDTGDAETNRDVH
jgi:hypothetical protein